ncbi:YopX family protein [Helicobacter himalayensis]|uniref:YopX family protein n=1 Tax=Helicobacter himalayensis TaxID=1591088 RepID=UPI003D6F5B3E
MKLENFSYRLWDKSARCFMYADTDKYLALASYKDLEIELYTGLKDKKGKKIYDGDILEVIYYYNKELLAEVIFKDFAFRVKVFNKNLREIDTLILKDTLFASIKVVGNIHENDLKDFK